jgi:hypothetical protein
MTDQQALPLRQVIRDFSEKARRFREWYREQGLGKENTRVSRTDPLLEARGWDSRDPDVVSP